MLDALKPQFDDDLSLDNLPDYLDALMGYLLSTKYLNIQKRGK